MRTVVGIATFAPQLSTVTGAPLDDVLAYCREAKTLGARLYADWKSRCGFLIGPMERAMAEAMFVIVRCTRPARAVETGVWRGVSSALILNAIARNGSGRLYSIDLPTYETSGRVNADGRWDGSFVASPSAVGDLVDSELRAAWDLRLGDAKELLPALLGELGSIDLFFHDSEHSYQHMMFEYRLAWSHLNDGGWLLTDDITWSPQTRAAWAEFTASCAARPYRFFGYDGNRGMVQHRPDRPRVNAP